MGRTGLSTALKSIGLLFLSLILLIFLIGGSLSPVRQLSGDSDALDFSGDKTTQFVLITLGILVVMGGMGGGLAFMFLRLTREVTIAKEQENVPTNPLEYRSYGHVMVGALAVGFGLLLVAIYFIVGLMPAQASTQAVITDRIFAIGFFTIAAIFGLVMGLFLHSLLFFRADPNDMTDGKHFHGNIPLELTWTFVPLIFVFILGAYTVTQYNDLVEEQEGEVAVKVEGFQWGWRFIYPPELFFDAETYAELDQRQRDDIEATGGVELGELVLLADQPVRLDLGSVDVIHSFWIPEMRVKQDVVPGVDTVIRYTPTLPGTYRVRCAELCGLTHWNMLADVQVMAQTEYEGWIEEVRVAFGNPIDAGRNVWEANCQRCHTITGASGTGPTWKDLVGSQREFTDGGTALADLAYITNSIYNPNDEIVRGFDAGLMPDNFSGSISDLELEQLFTFMCSESVHAPDVPECMPLLEAAQQQDTEAEADDSTTTDGVEDTGQTDTDATSSDDGTDTTDGNQPENNILG